jgi:hypothetical protein
MPSGVDDAARRTGQVNPHGQAGDELALARLLGERIIRQPGLLGQLNPPPPGVAQAPNQHGRQQGGIHRVAHRVGQRHMQRVPLQRKIESVAADLTRRLQPGGERELPGLAGKGTRQQPMLDLRRQRQRYRPLPPLEEVGVAAVRNHHVRQEVRRQSHIGHRLLTREVLQPQLQNTDRLAAAGHRREQASTAVLDDHLDRLGCQRPSVRRPN